MATVRELLRSGDDLPVESARRDAEILLGHCLGQSRSWLYTWPEREVSAAQAEHYLQLLAERRRGQPIAYLVGEREFWSLPLVVNQHTLIPRPETETLVEWALELRLPDTAPIPARLVVRNLFRITRRGGAEVLRAGCEFADLPRGAEDVIQRYILRVERTRNARERGRL